VLGNACMMAEDEAIDVHDLPETLHQAIPVKSLENEEPLTMAEMQQRHACRVLEGLGGNKVQTARALGISRATLYSILREEANGEEANGDDEDALAAEAASSGPNGSHTNA
jgi:transcriptional regulator of acetoin/glycerol metabolism